MAGHFPSPLPERERFLSWCAIGTSLDDAWAHIQAGAPALSRSEAEDLLVEIQCTTGKRHYIFEIASKLTQITS